MGINFCRRRWRLLNLLPSQSNKRRRWILLFLASPCAEQRSRTVGLPVFVRQFDIVVFALARRRKQWINVLLVFNPFLWIWIQFTNQLCRWRRCVLRRLDWWLLGRLDLMAGLDGIQRLIVAVYWMVCVRVANFIIYRYQWLPFHLLNFFYQILLNLFHLDNLLLELWDFTNFITISVKFMGGSFQLLILLFQFIILL